MLDKLHIYETDSDEKRKEAAEQRKRVIWHIAKLGLTRPQAQILAGQVAKACEAAYASGYADGQQCEYEMGVIVGE